MQNLTDKGTLSEKLFTANLTTSYPLEQALIVPH